MSTSQISIKPANHRIYPCPYDKKIALVKKIIQENKDTDILLVCSSDVDLLKEAFQNDALQIVEDRELVQNKELKCEFLISYDIPVKAIVYIARVSRATQKAVLLLDKGEQKVLHSIETLLGRAIMQETVEGFAYEVVVKPEQDSRKSKKLSKDKIIEIAKQRHKDATVEKPAQWKEKKKVPNKFLGKDENNKALFSGKSGERNHSYDGTPKAKYSAPKKVGKTINIKARKAQED